MNNHMTRKSRIGWFRLACTTACVAAVTGCAQNLNKDDDCCPPTPTTQPIHSSVNDFVEAQVANGAADDPTLYRGHFVGDRLNSLGRAKLALLARHHEPGQHVTVYVDTRDADAADAADLPPARRDAITAYLTHAGIPADDLEVRAGPNTDGYHTHPAAESIRGLLKTDSDYQSQQGGPSMGAPGGDYGGASAGGSPTGPSK
jgi:hypothetical protein